MSYESLECLLLLSVLMCGFVVASSSLSGVVSVFSLFSARSFTHAKIPLVVFIFHIYICTNAQFSDTVCLQLMYLLCYNILYTIYSNSPVLRMYEYFYVYIYTILKTYTSRVHLSFQALAFFTKLTVKNGK